MRESALISDATRVVARRVNKVCECGVVTVILETMTSERLISEALL